MFKNNLKKEKLTVTFLYLKQSVVVKFCLNSKVFYISHFTFLNNNFTFL